MYRRNSHDQEYGFNPVFKHTPDLPPIESNRVHGEAPKYLESGYDELPQTDAVVNTWAKAEWTTMVRVKQLKRRRDIRGPEVVGQLTTNI